MSAGVRSEEGPSPRVCARVAGVMYLITIALGAAEQFWMRGSIYAASTPSVIRASRRGFPPGCGTCSSAPDTA